MISIITPSFRQLDWLRLAIASVADQKGVDVEHIIQDGGTEGAREIVTNMTKFSVNACYHPSVFVEKDAGMYDAINRGLHRSRGEICGYLNCDEQYLPDTLAPVVAAFKRDPQVDVFLAGSVVVDRNGRYICSRPALKPRLSDVKAGLMYNLSCSMFFRSKLFRERNIFFNPKLRVIGDLDWLRRVMDAGAHVEILNSYTSAFADLGTNLALSPAATAESHFARRSTGIFPRLGFQATVALHRVSRLLAGHYFLRPFNYSIYTSSDDKQRRTFQVTNPTGIWRNRL